MIVPAGKRKEQVAQGPLKNQSILDDVLFNKIAIDVGGLVDNPAQKQEQKQPRGKIDDVMNSGGLNAPEQADRHEQQVDPMNQTPQSTQGFQPAGGNDLSAVPLDQPQDQQQQGASIRQNITQISQYLTQRGFALQDHPKSLGNEGLYQFIIGPRQGLGMPPAELDQVNEMADTIAQLMGATVPDTPEAISVADNKTGVFKIVVQMTPQLQKVTKGI